MGQENTSTLSVRAIRIACALVLSVFWQPAYAQEQDYMPYYIIGDRVNMRYDTSLEGDVAFRANYGEKFMCRRLSDNWYAWTTNYMDGCVSSRYIAEEKEFIRLAESLPKKNGTTMYSLLKHYRKTGRRDQAEKLSLDIINNYIGKEFPVYREACPLYGELAYYAVLRGDQYYTDYSDPQVYNYCTRVAAKAKDSLIVAFALSDLARCHLIQRNYVQAESALFECLWHYGNHLHIPTSCEEYDIGRRTSLLRDIRYTSVSLYYLASPEERSRLLQLLRNEAAADEHGPETTVQNLAREILEVLAVEW